MEPKFWRGSILLFPASHAYLVEFSHYEPPVVSGTLYFLRSAGLWQKNAVTPGHILRAYNGFPKVKPFTRCSKSSPVHSCEMKLHRILDLHFLYWVNESGDDQLPAHTPLVKGCSGLAARPTGKIFSARALRKPAINKFNISIRRSVGLSGSFQIPAE